MSETIDRPTEAQDWTNDHNYLHGGDISHDHDHRQIRTQTARFLMALRATTPPHNTQGARP